jgi:hypothetical protein
MRALALCSVVALAATLVFADDHVVLFDEDVDFSTFKTFMIGSGRMKSDRPELGFPAVTATIAEAIRTGLISKSLKEVSDSPGLMVDFHVTGKDFVIGSFGKPNPVTPRGGRGGTGGAAVDFTEATLVIDLQDVRSKTLIWRGVYHDTESDARRLAEALPKDAAVLMSEYPPKKRN